MQRTGMISHARLEALTDVSHKLRNILQELAELQAACPSVVGVQKFKNRVKRGEKLRKSQL